MEGTGTWPEKLTNPLKAGMIFRESHVGPSGI